MPYIQITPKLRDTIKDERKKAKLRGDVLSKELGKSASYISQIENGRITNIEIEMFYKIFEKIINLPEESRNAYINQILDNMSTENIEDEEWMITFDMQYRMFKIPDAIIQLIKEKRANCKISSRDLVKYINKNEGTEEFEKIEYNQLKVFVHERGVGYTIKFKFDLDYIDKIENNEIQFSNYINLLGILYRLNVLQGQPDFEAMESAENTLKENSILTIIERESLKQQNRKSKVDKGESFEESDIEPTDLDKEYSANISKIVSHLNFVRDLNADVAVNVTSNLSHNMNIDAGFMLQIFSLPFGKMQLTSKEEKINFINEVKELIEKYSKLTGLDLSYISDKNKPPMM